MVCRAQYLQCRIQSRMKSRGEKMLIRTVSMLNGPEPFRNPPDLSNDLVVSAGSITNNTAFIGISGSTITGRLVPGDTLTIGSVVFTVQPMPAWVATDADGIPLTDGNGNPVIGEPLIYNTDCLADDNSFPVVPISPAQAMLVGQPVSSLTFLADQPCWGNEMSRQKMVGLGWTETDSIGIEIAGEDVLEPKVNDQLILREGTDLRSIMSVGVKRDGSVNLLYQIQAK